MAFINSVGIPSDIVSHIHSYSDTYKSDFDIVIRDLERPSWRKYCMRYIDSLEDPILQKAGYLWAYIYGARGYRYAYTYNFLDSIERVTDDREDGDLIRIRSFNKIDTKVYTHYVSYNTVSITNFDEFQRTRYEDDYEDDYEEFWNNEVYEEHDENL